LTIDECVRLNFGFMEQPDELKVNLLIDFREQRSGITGEIEKLTRKVTFTMGNLPAGDYLIADKIIVERKTITDFLASVKSGRIFKQAFRMAHSGKNGLIIIEGDKSMVNTGSMSRKAVQGALILLTVFVGIPVIRSLNIKETASLLVDIINQCQQRELPSLKPILSVSASVRFNKKQRQKLLMLQNISGIGTGKALALVYSFSTIENILNASPSDLIEVRGIGNKLAERISTIFHEPF
jgi:DNA excision repair protein ERCC-4